MSPHLDERSIYEEVARVYAPTVTHGGPSGAAVQRSATAAFRPSAARARRSAASAAGHRHIQAGRQLFRRRSELLLHTPSLLRSSKSVLPGLETFSLTAAIPAPMMRATFITLPVLAVR
jgi:hypothetical protein